MKQYKTYSPEETKKVASDLAKKITSGTIALSGELGAGKTTFVQGFAKGLGIKDKIISPTFVLIRQHKFNEKNLPARLAKASTKRAGRQVLYHIDLYRLEGNIDIKELGIEELILNTNNIILIEWAEKIEKYLPKNLVKINIEKKLDYRLITIF